MLKFDTLALPMVMVPGEENVVDSLATSSSSAVAKVTILNVEPGAYSVPVARLISEVSDVPEFAWAITCSKSVAS